MHYPHGGHLHHPARALEYAHQDLSEQAVQETHHRPGTILHPADNSITVSFQDIIKCKREEELFILAAIVESSDDAIFSTTLEGRVLSWNKSAEHVYGYSAQEMLGKPVHTTVPADRRQELEDILRQLREEHRIDHFETVRRRKDGSSIDVSLTISPLRDATGKIIGASTIARDITERKQLEEKLRESERRFRALIEKSSDAIVLIGMDASVLYASSSTTHLLGYAPEELLNRKAFELIHPADLETTLYALGGIVQEPEANVIVECRVRYKHGTFRWMEASVTNYLDEPGVHGIVCNYRDITERKLLEERIWQSEQQLYAIVDSSPAIISLKDIHGHYILINEQGKHLFHLPKQHILGKTDDDLFPQEIAATLRANDQAVLQTGKAYKWEEVVPQDDGLHTYLAVKFPLFDPTGVPYAVCAISADITERKLMEQRKDDFISIASHELRTSLAVVQAYTQLLHMKLEEMDRQEVSRRLSKMDTQIKKLTELMTDMLDISRIRAGTLPFAEEPLDVDELVREVVESLQQVTMQHQILIEGTAKCEIVGDKNRLGQVLTNLISNAIKYSPYAEKILVKVAQTPDQLILSVQDFGIGISKGHRAKIFERFYRVHSNEEKTYPGLGIGLSIAREIIEHYKGNIWVESAEGKGSIFSFSLPLIGKS